MFPIPLRPTFRFPSTFSVARPTSRSTCAWQKRLVSDQSEVERTEPNLAVEVLAAAVVVEAARAVVVVHSEEPVVAAWAPRATVATV